jgi:hypothetical protein
MFKILKVLKILKIPFDTRGINWRFTSFVVNRPLQNPPFCFYSYTSCSYTYLCLILPLVLHAGLRNSWLYLQVSRTTGLVV